MRPARGSYLIRFFVLTYLLFWVLLGITGALISLKVPTLVQTIMQNVCAWAPTVSIIILFRKLFPNTTVRAYLKENFLSKVHWITFPLILLIQAAIVCIAVTFYLVLNNIPLSSLSLIAATSLLPTFLINITSGPIGEELGWRSFALNELQRKYTPFTASIILGAVWGLWHTPLLILSGFSGMNLVLYFVFFLVGIMSLSVTITVFYNRQKNIMIAMWIHFLFNFLLKIPKIDLLPLFEYTASAYALLALVLLLIDRRRLFVRPAVAAQPAGSRSTVST
jgi:membrane protease YdiL (CAAX protease family)